MCTFCKIVNHEIPSFTIYEDDRFMAFLDISQATIGHTLVVCKKHIPSVLDLDEETAKDLFALTVRLTKQITKALNVVDVNIINNCGFLAGQTIEHMHMHILPRYLEDNLEIAFSNTPFTVDDFKSLQQKILGS